MKLYVVQNTAGKYFRPRGYGGYGEQWQDSLDKAKFYPKIGTAKSQCTFWFNANPKLGCPHVLEFTLDAEKAVKIDVLEDAKKSAERKAKKEAKYEEARKAWEATQNISTIKRLLPTLTTEQKKTLGL